MDDKKNFMVSLFAGLAILLAVGSITAGVLLTHAAQVQTRQERIRNIRSACQDLNHRHDDALRVTFQLLANPAVPPRRQLTFDQQKKRDAALTAWIGAIVPKHDCEALVLKQVGR